MKSSYTPAYPLLSLKMSMKSENVKPLASTSTNTIHQCPHTSDLSACRGSPLRLSIFVLALLQVLFIKSSMSLYTCRDSPYESKKFTLLLESKYTHSQCLPGSLDLTLFTM